MRQVAQHHRPLGRVDIVFIPLCISVLLFFTASAFARSEYKLNSVFESQFNTALDTSNSIVKETGTPKNITLTGIAFDNTHHYLYVTDSGSPPKGVIDRFKIEGAGSSVKVKFECELGGTNMEVSAKPCVSGKQATEALTTFAGITVGTGGEVFVVNNVSTAEDIVEFSATGEFVQTITGWTSPSAVKFATPHDVAVEPTTGDLFVSQFTSKVGMIDKLKRTGSFAPYTYELVQELSNAKNSELPSTFEPDTTSGLTVDGSDDLYIDDEKNEKIYRFVPQSANKELDTFDATGELPTAVKLAPVGTDSATNALFVGLTTKIDWYSYNFSSTPVVGELTKVEEFCVTTSTCSSSTQPKQTKGLAVSSAGVVYAADTSLSPESVEDYELVEPPVVGACSVSKNTTTAATFEGTVNPDNYSTKYKFEYGKEPSFAEATTEEGPISGASAEIVSVIVKGLTPETKYDCRIFAESTGGFARGTSDSFETLPAVVGVKTLSVSNPTFEGATLNGSLRPEGTPSVEYFFEYGTTSAYGHSTTPQTSSATEVAPSASISKLVPLTTYHYRLVTKRTIEGKTFEKDGPDETFTTTGLQPEVLSESVSVTGPFSATLEATINPSNSATTYWFEYGTSPTSEQAFIPTGTVSGDGSIQAAPEVLQDLQPNTTYYYHVVAENQFGRIEGIEGPKGPEEKSFTTPPAYAPEVSLAPVGEVGQTSASVAATIDPHGFATEYEIDLGAGGSYAPAVVLSAGEGEAPVAVSYALSGLAPETAYQVRIVAWNAVGEVASTVQSFTTATSAAVVFTQPPAPLLLSAMPVGVAEAMETPSSTKPMTNAQKLAKALKTCKKEAKSKRASCEKQARAKYGAKTKAKAK